MSKHRASNSKRILALTGAIILSALNIVNLPTANAQVPQYRGCVDDFDNGRQIGTVDVGEEPNTLVASIYGNDKFYISGKGTIDKEKFKAISKNGCVVIQEGSQVSLPEDSSYLFAEMQTTEFPDNLDTSQVKNMSHMFEKSIYAEPNVKNWDTSNVTDMTSMFDHAEQANPDVRRWNLAGLNANDPWKVDSMFCSAPKAVLWQQTELSKHSVDCDGKVPDPSTFPEPTPLDDNEQSTDGKGSRLPIALLVVVPLLVLAAIGAAIMQLGLIRPPMI